jgi:hypothetical protein
MDMAILLPDGFWPEGIAPGRGHSFFVGSLGDGAILGGDLRTVEGDIAVAAQDGCIAIGISIDLRTNYLFVAGGPSGHRHRRRFRRPDHDCQVWQRPVRGQRTLWYASYTRHRARRSAGFQALSDRRSWNQS